MFDIENSLGFILAKCHQRAFHALREKLEKYNLTPPQFAALSFLLKKDGINQIQLGEMMEADRTTISGIIDRLEKMDLIERIPNPIDRRSCVLLITPKASRISRELESLALEFNRSLAEPLSEHEKNKLIEYLKRIRAKKI